MSGENNLTWMIGQWRIYVAEGEYFWDWNVRHIEIGWEVSAQAPDRELAIINALHTAERLERGNKICMYYVMILGKEDTIPAKPDTDARTWMAFALNKHIKDIDFERYELRLRESELPMRLDLPIGLAGNRWLEIVEKVTPPFSPESGLTLNA